MDLSSAKTIKALLHKYGVRPSKKLGQHFLVDKKVLTKIIQVSHLSQKVASSAALVAKAATCRRSKDLVIEIGPGIGTITKKLAQKADRVIAIEKDKKMVEVLKETVGHYKNVEIIQGDILKVDIEKIIKLVRSCTPNQKCTMVPSLTRNQQDSRFQIPDSYKIVANLPYYLTSPAIRMFLENEIKPSEIVLLIQKEEAERICAKPGQMNVLSIIVQFYGKPEIIDFVPRRASWPVPKVDFAILKISQIRAPRISRIEERLFFEIVKAGFSSRRKQLVNTLSEKLSIQKEQIKKILLKAGINPTARAQELSVGEWVRLTNILS